MSDRDNLGNRIHESEIAKKRRRGIYSKAYHRYFEGYSEVIVPKANGKGTKIKRIYTANFYRQDLPQQQRTLIRLLYALLFLCAVALFIFSGIQPVIINSTWYVVIFQASSLGFLSWILIAFFSYLPAKRDLTIIEFRKSSLHLIRASLGATISLLLIALTSLLFTFLNPKEDDLPIILCSSRNAIAGFLILGIYMIEGKVKYLTIQNKYQQSGNSYEIN